jgi:hypothetical protein
MPEREVRYCTTEDGVRIAYAARGETALKGFEDAVRLYKAGWQE